MDGFNSIDGKMHPQDKRNLVIFAVLALLVWFGFDHYVLGPRLEQMKAARAAAQALPTLASADGLGAERPRDEVLAAGIRIPVRNDKIFGTISLTGGRIDDMSLAAHYKTLEKTEHVVLMTPAGTAHARYAELGWLPGADVTAQDLPGNDTRWRLAAGSAETLGANGTIALEWDNGRGLLFRREIALDDDYMMTVTQSVTNRGGAAVTLYPYALIAQRGLPEEYFGQATVHEGAIGYVGGKLHELSYKKLAKEGRVEYRASSGWIGITDKYWFSSLIPAQDEGAKYRFLYTPSSYGDQPPLYQTDIVGTARVVQAGETVSTVKHLFTGAKEIEALQKYERTLGVRHFDLAVDFGLWYILTKPLFWVLNFLAGHVGNFGVAIIILTVMVRAAVFPLAQASFRSFAKLRQVTPQMKELREQHKDDKVALQKALAALYEKEKVNPMAGCLPILVQIPIFFALFKVFSVTIEMRHAPFFGWIHDLSQPDPTSVFNLFGLIPWNPPAFLMIGAWPCLMLLFSLLQQRMSPPPQDKVQATMLRFMPFMMAFILARFASGLVVYWTFSNALSVLQQYVLLRSMGQKVSFFRRSAAEQEMEQAVKDGPSVHPGLVVAEHQVEEALGVADRPVTPPKPRRKKKR